MVMSLYNVITAKNAMKHIGGPNYAYIFMGAVFAFLEGLLFAYFTYDLLSEHMLSIEEN